MLFVFQVDTGRMVTFEVELATKSVETFKQHVERTCFIPVDKQVLLISGGEYLDPEATVASYAAGTDSNPIYLFSKAIIESNTPPPPLQDPGQDIDLDRKVRDSSSLPPTLSTVESRAKLAEQFYNCGLERIRICEKLVHEQHLQQQGWSSVVANLEDLSVALRTRWNFYKGVYGKYLEKRSTYFEFLHRFKEDLLNLQRIPVLPALHASHDILVPDPNIVSSSSGGSGGGEENLTLLDWISQREGFAKDLYENCYNGLHQMDENGFRIFGAEVETKLKHVDYPDMKEVKGIGERLSGLEQLMREAKKCVQEQKDLAQSFQRNQMRANVLQEQSILPDLCATHFQQLQVLLENHNKLKSITTRCVDAKNELSKNLYMRLQWVVYQENNILEADNKLVFSFANLKNLQRHLNLLQQVHLAPVIFLTAVAEVIRRRSYSQSFLLWASDLSCQSLTVYNEEVAKRKDFQAQFEGHFLSALFPGMEDLPPAFAIQSPSLFDTKLPKLTLEDLEILRERLPDFADLLKIPDLSAMTNFFMGRSAASSGKEEDKNDHKAVEEKLMAVVEKAGCASMMDQNLLKVIENEPPLTTPHGLPHLKDIDKGCESETDTEEFEKVGQSPFELHFDKGIPSPKPGTQDVSTLTEDNLQISRTEHDRLRAVLSKVFQLAVHVQNQLRCELDETKAELVKNRSDFQQYCGELTTSWVRIVEDKERSDREAIQRLTVDHELEISDFRKNALAKNVEIKSIREENVLIRTKLEESLADNEKVLKRLEEMAQENRLKCDDFQRKLDEMVVEKEKAVKEVTDKLKCEHKGELENIRARFKLMTMERSPSENSLEKIERGEFTSITNHEALLLQMTENMESEKEVAVSDAISKEAQKWQKIMEDRSKDLQLRFEEDKNRAIQEVTARLMDDKDKQIDILREQLKNLRLENIKYKDTVHQLVEGKEDSINEIAHRIEELERENGALKLQLDKCKEERIATMSTSVAVIERKVDATTSPKSSRKRRDSKITIDACSKGNTVLVGWEPVYQNFRVLIDSEYLYFVHSESLEPLGLQVKDGAPNKKYCFAEVVDREFCSARKDTNRFKVPMGTRFFRVRLAPANIIRTAAFWSPATPSHMSQSQNVSCSAVSELQCTSEGPAASDSLPSSPTRLWGEQHSSEMSSTQSVIFEEKGEDSSSSPLKAPEDSIEAISGDIEKGTELTENFNVEVQASIDRNKIAYIFSFFIMIYFIDNFLNVYICY